MGGIHMRNVKLQVSDGFADDVFIEGWQERSVWGWDGATRSFYAQLWRNGSPKDAPPEIWLDGVTDPYPRPECLALRLVEVMRADPLAAVNGLGIGAGDEPPAPLAVVQGELRTWEPEHEGFGLGRRIGLEWLSGQRRECPGSGWTWNGDVPTRPFINAEARLVTGRIHSGESDGVLSGVDDALAWSLSS